MHINRLKYVILPGSHPDPMFYKMYKSAYECWHHVWSEAYKEMKFDKSLYSDAFTRQDYIGAIFFEDKCLALCFFRWADFSLPDFANDSYFSYWTNEDLQHLHKNGSQIIISSNFTIHPLARKGNLDFSMKDLLTGISVEFFKNSTADAMAANLRVDKKVNESCEKWGANLIRANVHVSGGICGDLMVFYQNKCQISHLENYDYVKMLWDHRTVVQQGVNHLIEVSNKNINLKVAI